MLKVRANSWHYWLWRLGREASSKPKNLCRYFWHCVFKIVAGLTVAGLALAGIAAILQVFYREPIVSTLVTLGFALAVGLFILAGYYVGAIVDRRKAEQEEAWRRYVRGESPWPYPEKKKKKKKQPNLVWAFLKARKQKYCPLIEVVDK